MKHYEEYLNINNRKGLPRSYWFNQIIRWFTILFALFAIIYAGWLIFNKVDANSDTFTKVVPFVIIFFGVNSLLRNLFSLNKLLFTTKSLKMEYLIRKPVVINWDNIISLKSKIARQKLLQITYTDETGKERVHELNLAFPKILEILNAIIELCPQAKLDDFMDSIAVGERKEETTEKSE